MRKAYAAFDDLFVYTHGILVPERRLPHEKFVNENTQGPPVNCKAMATVMNYLRGQVLWRAAKGISLPILDFLCKAEVDKPDVALSIQKYIFRFQVAINNPLYIVKEFDSKSYLGRIELSGVFVEPARAP